MAELSFPHRSLGSRKNVNTNERMSQENVLRINQHLHFLDMDSQIALD